MDDDHAVGSATMVALVQAATSLPMFLLSLPAEALADVLDRRRLLLFTEIWMALSAAGLGLLTLAGAAGPWTLLAFTFLLGLETALTAPAWQAIVPEIVPREGPARRHQAAEFAAAMRELRRIRLRDGALQWVLFTVAETPGAYAEVFLVRSWIEHLRQHERVTVADEEIRLRAGSFHTGKEPPVVRHLIAEPMIRVKNSPGQVEGRERLRFQTAGLNTSAENLYGAAPGTASGTADVYRERGVPI